MEGSYSEYVVFQADPAGLERVSSVDSDGRDLPLQTGADPAAWRVNVDAEGVVSYLLDDPSTVEDPAPGQVRPWSLDGRVLTESDESVPECLTFHTGFEHGPC